MIVDAQTVADNLNFRSKIDGTIEDMLSVIGIALDSVIASCENHVESNEDDHFSKPELENHVESEPEQPKNISVDDLIAESYTYGKSDEQVAEEFKSDLNDTVKNFAWLLVALGIAMDNEDKKQIVQLLKQKTIDLVQRERKLKASAKERT